MAMAELTNETQNALKCIDSLLRVALQELIHLQFENLITKFGSSAAISERLAVVNIYSFLLLFVILLLCLEFSSTEPVVFRF